jgi:hypothetical protein
VVQGIQIPIPIRYISTSYLKISFRKGFQIYATHMEEPTKNKESFLEYFPILKEYEDVFLEFLRLPPKRDIYFSIELITRDTPMYKNPYRMSTLELKELKM